MQWTVNVLVFQRTREGCSMGGWSASTHSNQNNQHDVRATASTCAAQTIALLSPQLNTRSVSRLTRLHQAHLFFVTLVATYTAKHRCSRLARAPSATTRVRLPTPIAMASNSWLSFIPAALLAFALFMAGQAKLTPILTPDIHAEIASKAPSWHTAMPYLVPPPPTSMYAIGGVEVAVAVLLVVGGGLRRWAALVAVVLMSGAVYTHVVLGEPINVAAGLLGLSAVTWLLSGPPARASGKKRQ